MAAEDFAYYLQKIPGALMFVGAGNSERGIVFPQHHPQYDIDEQALLNGVEVMVNAAFKLLDTAGGDDCVKTRHPDIDARVAE